TRSKRDWSSDVCSSDSYILSFITDISVLESTSQLNISKFISGYVVIIFIIIVLLNTISESCLSNPIKNLTLQFSYTFIDIKSFFISAIAILSLLFNLYKSALIIKSNLSDLLMNKFASFDKYCFLSLGFICVILL